MAHTLSWRCCWCLTEEEKAAARVDQKINKLLLEHKRQVRGELKLLLLGELVGTQTADVITETLRSQQGPCVRGAGRGTGKPSPSYLLGSLRA